MAVRKVSNSKSDFKVISIGANLALVRPHTISYWSSISTMSLSFTISEILSLISKNINRSHDPDTFLSGVIYHVCNSTLRYQLSQEI